MAQTNVDDRLSMAHVGPDPAEAQSLESMAADIARSQPAPDQNDPDDPRLQREYTFPFSHEDAGTLYRGRFTHRVPTVGQRLQIGAMESRLLGGAAYDSFDPFWGGVAKAIAHMHYCLRPVPDSLEPTGWAADFRTLDRAGPIIALYEEVLEHERIFLDPGKRSPSGAGGAGHAPDNARAVVRGQVQDSG